MWRSNVRPSATTKRWVRRRVTPSESSNAAGSQVNSLPVSTRTSETWASRPPALTFSMPTVVRKSPMSLMMPPDCDATSIESMRGGAFGRRRSCAQSMEQRRHCRTERLAQLQQSRDEPRTYRVQLLLRLLDASRTVHCHAACALVVQPLPRQRLLELALQLGLPLGEPLEQALVLVLVADVDVALRPHAPVAGEVRHVRDAANSGAERVPVRRLGHSRVGELVLLAQLVDQRLVERKVRLTLTAAPVSAGERHVTGRVVYREQPLDLFCTLLVADTDLLPPVVHRSCNASRLDLCLRREDHAHIALPKIQPGEPRPVGLVAVADPASPDGFFHAGTRSQPIAQVARKRPQLSRYQPKHLVDRCHLAAAATRILLR